MPINPLRRNDPISGNSSSRYGQKTDPYLASPGALGASARSLSSAVPHSNSTGVLAKVTDFFQKHPGLTVSLKCLSVAIVITGLIAASAFTFGAAIPMLGALSAASSYGAFIGAAALTGTAVGLALSPIGALLMANKADMHKCTEHNLTDLATFLASTAITTTLITGLFTFIGASIGVDAGLGAKEGIYFVGSAGIGLSTFIVASILSEMSTK